MSMLIYPSKLDTVKIELNINRVLTWALTGVWGARNGFLVIEKVSNPIRE